jgi:hypothetical protein
MKGDRGGNIEESNSIDQAKKGDILIFRDEKGDISHTAIFNDDEDCSVTSKNGYKAPQKNNESIGALKKPYGDKITVTAPAENKQVDALKKEGENGLAEYSEEEVQKALAEKK